MLELCYTSKRNGALYSHDFENKKELENFIDRNYNLLLGCRVQIYSNNGTCIKRYLKFGYKWNIGLKKFTLR